MNYTKKKSILFHLIIVIAGVSIISAIISSVVHYSFTSRLIKQTVNQQATNALELANSILSDEYTLYINHDLKLLQQSPLINSLDSNDFDQKTDKYFKAKHILKNFITYSDSIYESILVINGAENDSILAESSPLNTDNTQRGKTAIQFSVTELLNNIKQSNQRGSIFSGPIKAGDQYLFLAGIKQHKTLNDPNSGAIIIVFNINKLIKKLEKIKIFDHTITWLFTHNGEVIYKPNEENTLDPYQHLFKEDATQKGSVIKHSAKEDKSSIKSLIKVAISLPSTITEHLLDELIFIAIALLLSIIIIALAIAYFTSKAIVLPISRLTMLSQKVAAGDFNVRMPTSRKDELGALSQTFNLMIQELDEQRHELQSLANKDTLTQLPNRRQFEEHLSIVLKSCNRNSQSIAVMYIDLDQFKDTNDSFGHPAGDKLIRDVSARLLKTVRQSDLVARLGGDEFAIILNPHKSRSDTEYVARKILTELNKPFLIEKHQIFSGGSIGISIYPEHGSDSTELVKNADAAMYKAKNMGRNSFQFYSENLTTKANERIVLGALIRNAVVNDQFTIFYQPKISLNSKKVIGAEALLRWNHKGQTILPSKIINIAESSGFIEKVDAWVLNKTFSQIKQWENSGTPIIPISINISGRLLDRNKIIDLLKQMFHKYAVDPKWIEIEITENDLITNHQETQKSLKIIHSLGVKIAIDDFGTGYSSLSYLKDLLADTLKIDRKFVVNAMTNHADREIASAIVKLARALHMHIVVEGIETKEQEHFFKELGAHSAQGFLYSKAMPIDKLFDYLKQQPKPINNP